MGNTTIAVLEEVTQVVEIVLPGPQGPVGDIHPSMPGLVQQATDAATSATDSALSADTSEANASASATSALASKDAAAVSETTATTKASEASTSATNAAASATTASTKASEASTSATDAAASAAAAATSATDTANALVGERSAVATLTNKTVNLSNNTLTGTTAQFNAALTDGDFATLAGAETLTNKTITGGTTNPTTLQEGGVDAVIQSDIGTEPNQIPLNQYLGSLAYRDENPAGAVVGTTAVQVLSGKSFSDNVGIGTSSPTGKLHVVGSAGGTYIDAAGNQIVMTHAGTNYLISNDPASSLELRAPLYTFKSENGITERLRIDASGNLGLGVTPRAWSSLTALHVKGTAHFAGFSSGAEGAFVTSNTYYNGTNWIYQMAAAASYFRQSGGAHQWYAAPSGQEGGTISFTQAMTLTANGYLLVGATSSDGAGSSRAQIGNASAATTGLLLKSNTSSASLYASSTSSSYLSWKTGTFMALGTAPDNLGTFSEAARITSDGYIRLASGSGGIQFNGDTAAANALDDYEEGTFTPKIIGTTAAGAGTYTKAVGRYTKVGNVVHFDLYLLWTAHTGTGNMLVADMPFVNSSLDSNYPVFSIFGATIALTANNTLACFMTPNSSQIQIQQLPVGGGANQTVPLDTSAELLISGSYRV